jgi:hypothetical protein
MDGCAPAQECREKILINGQPMIGKPGKRVGCRDRPFGIVTVISLFVFIRNPANVCPIATLANRVQQFKERVFALAANNTIDVVCIENGGCVIRGEISTPNNTHMRKERSNPAASFDGPYCLRARHNRDREHFD